MVMAMNDIEFKGSTYRDPQIYAYVEADHTYHMHAHIRYNDAIDDETPSKRRPVRNTVSNRKAAGSRKNKRHRFVPTRARDSRDDEARANEPERFIGAESVPMHYTRFHDITTMFPLAPGLKQPAERWPS